MLKQKLKKIPLLKYLYNRMRNAFACYATKSYSQEGEDLILKRIFEKQPKGFYVDIGAHHPFRFSNTYLFYKKGWRGINLDAMPNSMKLFKRYRKQDINLEFPIGKDNQELQYYIFNERALNTFDSSKVQEILQHPHYKLQDTKTLKLQSLKKILDTYLPIGTTIDFMSIDVEGLDMQVLQSNDWKHYRPKILLVEALGGGGWKKFCNPKLFYFSLNTITHYLQNLSTLSSLKINPLGAKQ